MQEGSVTPSGCGASTRRRQLADFIHHLFYGSGEMAVADWALRLGVTPQQVEQWLIDGGFNEGAGPMPPRAMHAVLTILLSDKPTSRTREETARLWASIRAIPLSELDGSATPAQWQHCTTLGEYVLKPQLDALVVELLLLPLPSCNTVLEETINRMARIRTFIGG